MLLSSRCTATIRYYLVQGVMVDATCTFWHAKGHKTFQKSLLETTLKILYNLWYSKVIPTESDTSLAGNLEDV
ncbi:MAG TPA: hypothetical protein DCG32_00755 [Sphaerochaeta sp.]|nr:hypothetical protein [Sphaerochaeta sp.]